MSNSVSIKKLYEVKKSQLEAQEFFAPHEVELPKSVMMYCGPCNKNFRFDYVTFYSNGSGCISGTDKKAIPIVTCPLCGARYCYTAKDSQTGSFILFLWVFLSLFYFLLGATGFVPVESVNDVVTYFILWLLSSVVVLSVRLLIAKKQ